MIRSPHHMTSAQHFARGPVHRSDALFQSVDMVPPLVREPIPVPAVNEAAWPDFDAASGEDEPTYRVITKGDHAAD